MTAIFASLPLAGVDQSHNSYSCERKSDGSSLPIDRVSLVLFLKQVDTLYFLCKDFYSFQGKRTELKKSKAQAGQFLSVCPVSPAPLLLHFWRSDRATSSLPMCCIWSFYSDLRLVWASNSLTAGSSLLCIGLRFPQLPLVTFSSKAQH